MLEFLFGALVGYGVGTYQPLKYRCQVCTGSNEGFGAMKVGNLYLCAHCINTKQPQVNSDGIVVKWNL